MDRKICLDSDIIIELLKGNEDIKDKINSIESTFYTTPINILEVWYSENKQTPAKDMLTNLKTINITKDISFLSGEIMKKLKSSGDILDFRDILIASSCIQNNIPLLTNNKKHFQRLTKFGLKLQ